MKHENKNLMRACGPVAKAGRRLGAWMAGLLLSAGLLATDAAHAAVAFEGCPLDAYQTIESPTDRYGLYGIDLATGSQLRIGELGSTAIFGVNFNAIGFNERDRFIYGMRREDGRLVRIGSDGAGGAEFVFPVPVIGLPANFNTFVADIGDDNHYYTLNETETQLWKINLATNTAQLVGPFSIPSGASRIADFAFNPLDGQLYGAGDNGVIIRINPLTAAAVPVSTSVRVPSKGAYGAVYFDSEGTFYANPNDGDVTQRIRNVHTASPVISRLPATGIGTVSNDGARCKRAPPPVADLNVIKTLDSEDGEVAGFAEPGEQLTYKLTVTNIGAVASGAHSFYEVLPANTTLVSVTGGTINCEIGATGARLCTITVPGPVAPLGGTTDVFLTVEVADPLPDEVGAITNIATDDTDLPPPEGCDPTSGTCATAPVCDPATDPDHCVVTPRTEPDVSISKELTSGGPTAQPGETLTYTITLSNAGNAAATNHAFYESIPAYTTLAALNGASSSDCAVGDAGRKTCTLTVATVPANGTATVSLTVTADAALPSGIRLYNLVTDEVCQEGDTTCTPPPPCDPATDPNQCTTPPVGCDPATDPDRCVVTPTNSVTVSKALTAGGPTAEPGETLTYTITLSNAGNVAATNHAFYESIPAYTTLAALSGASSSDCAVGDAGRKTCTLTVATVPANGTATVSLTVTADAALPSGIRLYNLVTDEVCQEGDTTCTPPPPCDPATDPNQCTTPPVGCDPATDPDRCVVTPTNSVTVSKALTAGGPTAEPGETLTYTITLSNAGNAAATNHAFYESIPAYTTLAALNGASSSDCAVGDAGRKTCTLTVATVPANGTATVSLTVTADAALPSGISLYNLVTDEVCQEGDTTCTPPPPCDPATDPNQCTTPPVGCDPATDPDRCVVTPTNSVTVSKALTAGGPTAEPGETLTYTITLSNAGNAAATNHAFYESIPAYTTLAALNGASSSDCAVGDAGRKTCTLTVATVPANGTATVSLTVTADAALPSGIRLYNLVTDEVCQEGDTTCTPPPPCDPATDPNQCTTPPVGCDPATDPDRCVVTPTNSVTVSKALTAGGPTAEPGETLTYTITLSNAGNVAATNHAFYESIPAYTTLAALNGASSSDCAVGDAGRKTCTLTVATVPANGTATVSLTVTADAALPSGISLYNLVTDEVCQEGDTTCTPPPPCDPATDPNQCTTPPVGCDPATDPDRCVVTPTNSVTVSKALTAGGPTAEPGETLTYTITLSNAGNAAATNHAFYESIPAYTTLAALNGASSSDCAVGDAGRKTCTLTVATVPANGTATVSLTVTADAALPSGISLYNLVTDEVCQEGDTTCTPPPPCDPATDPNQCTTPPVGCDPATDPDRCVVTPTNSVTVSKALTAGGPTAEPGETLTYTITLSNAGNAAATNHAFYESIPAYTTLAALNGASSSDCAVGDAGRKTCTLTVASVPANGTATVSLTVTADAALPSGISLYNLVTDTICDPADTTCTPPAPCDPATDPDRCTTPPVGCDPATDPDRCVSTETDSSRVTVAKRLSGESGSREGKAEAGETLTYTITLTNVGDGEAQDHSFYELLPQYSTLVSIESANPVLSSCQPGDGQRLCQIDVTGPIAGNGGSVEVIVAVQVDDSLPTGVSQLVNIVTDDTNQPPVGCDDTGLCTPPPPSVCDDLDPEHCVPTPIGPVLTIKKEVKGEPVLVAGSVDTFLVTYELTVANEGGGEGTYDLTDQARFDADASVIAASYQRGEESAVNLTGSSEWVLATDRNLAAGEQDIYVLNLQVQVEVGSDTSNDICKVGEGAAGNGLLNDAVLQEGEIELRDDACVDTPKPGISSQLAVEKVGSTRDAEIGDLVNYSIRVRNNGDGVAIRPLLVDRLPAGFTVLQDSLRVSGANVESVAGVPGPRIEVTLDRIDPGAEVLLTYSVRLGVGSLEGDGINRVHAECREQATATSTEICSNESRWKVDVDAGVFTEEGCVVGQIFVDCSANSIKDEEELGIPGVRLYFEDGTFLISDSEGKYSYCGLRATTHVLKVDKITLPTRSRLVTSSSRNVGDAGSLIIDLKKGELHRADFIEGSCNSEVIEQVKARKAQGEVSSVQTEANQPALKFGSKPAPQGNPLRQGTDSADQPIEQPRRQEGDEDGESNPGS